MTTRALPFAVAAILAGLTTSPVATQDTRPQQIFRGGTDVVMVDVSVRDGGRPVTGLDAADFQLTDNGVRQRIESVEAAAVPIDVTLVVDVSGNVQRPPGDYRSPDPITAAIEDEVRGVTSILRPGDRIRLLAMGDYVQQLWPMQPVSPQMPLPRAQANGLGALYDTLTAALLQLVEPARRHVIVASTKGFDTISSVDATAVRAVSERSDALLHLVALEQAMDNEAQFAGFQCGFLGFCWPTRRSWIPVQRRLIGPAPDHRVLPDGVILRDAAQLTGGHLHRTTVGGVPTLSGTFRRAFDDFRSGYVLRYTPEGVDRGGWHAIEVRVPRNRSYTVRARNGYGIDETPPPATPPPLPEEPTTLADLTAAYDRAAFQPVVVGLRQVSDPARLIRDFEDAGNPWPAAPRREAAFAIELAESAVYSARSATRQEAYDLLARFTRLVRHPLEPNQFERYWHFAALTQLEGAIRPDATEPFVERALARFPDEPRFHLSRGVVRDQRWAGDRIVGDDVVDAAGAPTPAHIAAVRSSYTAAMAFPETAIEARVRLAWFLHRIDQHDEALTLLNEAGSLPNAEPAMQYLLHLFAGRVLDALGRHDEAAAAYRAALTVVPAAQSARVALMNTLIQQGAREQAEALAEQVQTETDDRLDPFWMYWQAQYRLYPAVMARLREMSR